MPSPVSGLIMKRCAVAGAASADCRYLGEARANYPGGELGMVECRLLGLGGDVDDHELVAALDGAPVPEARRAPDPRRPVGDVHGEYLVTRVQLVRAGVIGGLSLGAEGSGEEHHRDNAREDAGDGCCGR